MTCDVAIIIPSYNREDTIRRAIDSVRRSAAHASENRLVFTYRIVVVDDSSIDGTVRVVQDCAAGHDDILLVRNPVNRGAAHARNRGALAADAHLLTFLDADDEVLPWHLGIGIGAFMGLSSLQFVEVGMRVEGMNVDPSWIPVLEGVSATNFFIRRHSFLLMGGFPEAEIFRKRGGEDACFHRAARHLLSTAKLPVVSVIYNWRPNNALDQQRIKFATPVGDYEPQPDDFAPPEMIAAIEAYGAFADRQFKGWRDGMPLAELVRESEAAIAAR